MKAKRCEIAQTSSKEKAWSWLLGNNFPELEARQNGSVTHANCSICFSSTTKLLVLSTGLKNQYVQHRTLYLVNFFDQLEKITVTPDRVFNATNGYKFDSPKPRTAVVE